MTFKTHKKRKSKKWRGNTTYGHGARKKPRSKGGKGMAGTGKRADQKKSLVIKLYGNNYFGKQGITSRKTEKKRNKVMNISQIQSNFDSLMKKFGKKDEIRLEEYKILGDGELTIKVTVIAKAFTESAKEKIEKAGGKAVLVNKSEKQ